MVIFLNVMNPINLTDLSDLTSEFRETSSDTLFSDNLMFDKVNINKMAAMPFHEMYANDHNKQK